MHSQDTQHLILQIGVSKHVYLHIKNKSDGNYVGMKQMLPYT